MVLSYSKWKRKENNPTTCYGTYSKKKRRKDKKKTKASKTHSSKFRMVIGCVIEYKYLNCFVALLNQAKASCIYNGMA
jgi:hypothetical protein